MAAGKAAERQKNRYGWEDFRRRYITAELRSRASLQRLHMAALKYAEVYPSVVSDLAVQEHKYSWIR